VGKIKAMEIQVKELVDSLHEQYHVLGSIDRYVRSVCPIDQADDDSLCFCKEKSERALEMIRSSRAMVIVCSDSLVFPEGENWGKTLIQVANPRLTFSRLLAKYFFRRPEPVIHPTAIIDEKARIGRNVHIGSNSYIGDCEIGDGTIIDGHVYIHAGTRIGKGVIIHAGVVIGTAAVAFERNENGELEWFPQISGVIIEDDVEVGANTIICRGSLSDTLVGKGTKLDALVHVAHGVRIGKHCIILAGTVICGSAKIGDQTWIGPITCIREGGITIGNRVVVGAGSVVHKDIPDNLIVMGSPARPIPNGGNNKAH
jgi:UDP-3-O-[3-hydroxymyristoyl] glucosamine N-acyltransferase